MMSPMSRDVRRLWHEFEEWTRLHAPDIARSLRPPARPESFEILEKALSLRLPEDVRDSYLIHDGQIEELRDGVFSGHVLLSLERVLEEWRAWKSLLDGGRILP